MSGDGQTDFAALMEPVVRALAGEPNAALSTKTELRYGSKGSLSVDLTKRVWYDHEENVGGGLFDFIRYEVPGEDPLDWLVQHGFLAPRMAAAAPEWKPHGDEKPRKGWHPSLVCVADVPSREVGWLWRGLIARGKVTIIGGDPGVSKSTLTIDLAARVTTGRPWPCSDARAPTGSVVMVTSEDDVGDTIRPRLAAAGADVTRVHVLKGMTDEARRRGFDLTSDIAPLKEAINEIADVVMIVIDPVTAYMGSPGKIDSYRVTDVRAMFEPLQDMAEQCGVALLGINHLTKSGNGAALMRLIGSVGMVALSRAAYLVVRDEMDSKRRLLLPAKNNLGDDRTGFAFKVVEKPTGYDAPPYAVAIEWENEKVVATADDALAATVKLTDGRRSEALEIAKNLIGRMLNGGPRKAKEIEDEARKLGISTKSMRNARSVLGVVSTKVGAHYEWSMPWQAQGELDVRQNINNAAPGPTQQGDEPPF